MNVLGENRKVVWWLPSKSMPVAQVDMAIRFVLSETVGDQSFRMQHADLKDGD